MNRALWTVQGLLSALFLFAGGAKLAMPLDEMEAATGLPGAFIVFIAVAEILGAIGLVLPWMLRIRPGLTPLAASGLVIIMTGATVMTAVTMDAASALFPLMTGLLVAFVAYGRSRLAPRRRSARQAALQAAS